LLLKAAIVGAKAVLPAPLFASIRRRRTKIDLGDLRRLEPIARDFGVDRGLPIDRHYIEAFLQRQSRDIHGRVLEIADATYTRRFGANRVVHSDVLHVNHDNPDATIVGDLTNANHIQSNAYDCIICTQTLMFIYDLRSAIRTLHRILKPGGVVLVTTAGISQICRWDADQWGDYWRMTSMGAKRLFEDQFGSENVKVETAGNALAAIAFLHGLAADDFSHSELDHVDRDYELIVGVRAEKPQ
jgi:SAM-dependent methyltransferase